MEQMEMTARRNDSLAAARNRIEKMRKANIGMTTITDRTKGAMRTIVEADEIHDLAEGITW
ncbi:MAG TPA: hypothetical protein PLI62_14180 [Spirochaetota bacterium]|nr:hypothetical protein [Spirochaetota bacterium]HQO03409.1 hypothetical protein [Spirochaetota bacterium]